jgi:hypothetical protein
MPWQVGRGRVGLQRIRKDAGALKALAFNEVDQIGELLVRFAREARNERRSHHQIRNVRTQLVEERLGFRTRHAARHATQHRIVGMLKRHVEIRDDLLACSEHRDQLVGDVHWIEVHQANPLDPVDLFQLSQELCQPRFAVQIDAVVGRVLRDDDQLFHAVGRELLRFLHNRFDRLGGVLAAHLRDRTEGAQPIATFRDLQVTKVLRRDAQAIGIGEGPNRRRLKDRALFFEVTDQAIGDLGDFVTAEHAHQVIDAGAFDQQFFFLSFGQAARDNHTARTASGFELEHLVDSRERLVARPLDEAAGVHDHKVGAVRVIDQSITVDLKQAEHALAVDQVFRTPQAHKGVAAFGGGGGGLF